MIDKRVIKTKTNIKNALISLIGEKSYDKITVTEICKAAKTSRITFYTYYSDKNAVVEDMFDFYMQEATKDYYAMEASSNPKRIPLKSYHHVLEAIINLYYNNLEFFAYTESFINPYLYSAFFNHTLKIAEDYIGRHSNSIKPKYSVKLTAILVCNSLWGVINEFHAKELSEAEVREHVNSIYSDLLHSNLFTVVE